MATGQRVWNRQPAGGSIGLGISPRTREAVRRRRRVRVRDGGHERLGVWVLWIAEQLVDAAFLRDVAEIQNGGAIAHVLNDGKVVRN